MVIDFITWYFVTGFMAMCYTYVKNLGRDVTDLDYLVLFAILCGGYASFYFVVRDIIQRIWWNK